MFDSPLTLNRSFAQAMLQGIGRTQKYNPIKRFLEKNYSSLTCYVSERTPLDFILICMRYGVARDRYKCHSDEEPSNSGWGFGSRVIGAN